MSESAGDRWEFSLLVDRASRIIEARGLSETYLGTRPNMLAGKYLVGYLDEAERLAFLRYMARLMVRGEAEPVIATLRTPSIGIKRFSMAARHGGGNAWWLMFSDEEKHPAGAATGFPDTEHGFASAEELAALADAHDHEAQPLDLSVFRAETLRGGSRKSVIPSEKRKALDDQLGESLKDHAYRKIVARPDIGEYALLHDRETTGSEIGRSMEQVARNNRMSGADLGLVHETRNLHTGVSAAEVMQEIRRKIRHGDASSLNGGAATLASGFNWMPAAITLACALVLLALWLLAQTRGQ